MKQPNYYFFSRNHVSPDAALWFFLEASSIDGYCKEVFLGCSQLNFSRTRSMTSKLWDVLSVVTKSIRLGMSFSEHLWKDAAGSILRVAASNSTNDSLDSIKIPNVYRILSYFVENHHSRIQWLWFHLSLFLQL